MLEPCLLSLNRLAFDLVELCHVEALCQEFMRAVTGIDNV